MKKILSFALICAFANLAVAKTEIVVSYSHAWFTELHNKIKEDFEKENPDVKIKFTAQTKSYEESAAKLLREKSINQLPDVAYISFNYLEPLLLKNIPIAIDKYFSKEDIEKNGFTKQMLNPTTIDNKIYGIPFAASLPIVYYNMDLVKKAGWNKELPKTWAEVFELANMINKLDKKYGVYFVNYTHIWLQMALVMSQGGDFLKDGKIGFNNDIGKWMLKLLSDFHNVANSPNVNDSSARKSFIAGNLGIYIASSAALNSIQTSVKDNFDFKTSKFPSVKPNGKLPVGGNLVMLTSDNEKKEIALKYMKFATGKIANANVPKFTGYMATNPLAKEELKDFYAKNPNQQTAPSQLNLMSIWPSFPGENALKISDTIHSYSEELLTGHRKDYEKVLEEMTQKVNKLLP